MKNISLVAIYCALAAATVGCAVTFLCRKISSASLSGPALTMIIDAAIAFLFLVAANFWSDRILTTTTPNETGNTSAPDPDHRFSVPLVMFIALLTMMAATCAGHFHAGGGVGYLNSAIGLGLLAALLAILGDLETAIPPAMLAGIFLDEAALVFLTMSVI